MRNYSLKQRDWCPENQNVFLQNKAVAYASGFQVGKNKSVEIQFNTDKIFIQQSRDQITFVLGKDRFSYALTDV